MPIDFNEKCDYLNADLSNNQYWLEYVTKLKIFCKKRVSFVDFNKKQISSNNHPSHKNFF